MTAGDYIRMAQGELMGGLEIVQTKIENATDVGVKGALDNASAWLTEALEDLAEHPQQGGAYFGFVIVAYLGTAPLYYRGFYRLDPADGRTKPILTTDFKGAMKLETRGAAEEILAEMKIPGWKVEEHGWME